MVECMGWVIMGFIFCRYAKQGVWLSGLCCRCSEESSGRGQRAPWHHQSLWGATEQDTQQASHLCECLWCAQQRVTLDVLVLLFFAVCAVRNWCHLELEQFYGWGTGSRTERLLVPIPVEAASFSPTPVPNPFTAPACTISGLKDARTCLRTVHFLLL